MIDNLQTVLPLFKSAYESNLDHEHMNIEWTDVKHAFDKYYERHDRHCDLKTVA